MSRNPFEIHFLLERMCVTLVSGLQLNKLTSVVTLWEGLFCF